MDPDGRARVGDYKTSGKLEKRSSLTWALKGEALQMPLYLELARSALEGLGLSVESLTGELLGLGPFYEDGLEIREVAAASYQEHAEAWGETVSVLMDLVEARAYPFNRLPRRCGRCAYRRACRQTHPPSGERMRAAPQFRRYFALADKSSSQPLLAEDAS
jgi:hypothetical protein